MNKTILAAMLIITPQVVATEAVEPPILRGYIQAGQLTFNDVVGDLEAITLSAGVQSTKLDAIYLSAGLEYGSIDNEVYGDEEDFIGIGGKVGYAFDLPYDLSVTPYLGMGAGYKHHTITNFDYSNGSVEVTKEKRKDFYTDVYMGAQVMAFDTAGLYLNIGNRAMNGFASDYTEVGFKYSF